MQVRIQRREKRRRAKDDDLSEDIRKFSMGEIADGRPKVLGRWVGVIRQRALNQHNAGFRADHAPAADSSSQSLCAFWGCRAAVQPITPQANTHLPRHPSGPKG